jgi:hypothetical protein
VLFEGKRNLVESLVRDWTMRRATLVAEKLVLFMARGRPFLSDAI